MFGFYIYNIFNPSITENKIHVSLCIIFYSKLLSSHFLSGNIYQTLDEMFDGEDNKKPEA